MACFPNRVIPVCLLAGTTGCVEMEGASIALRGPPDRSTTVEETVEVSEVTLPDVPQGVFLLAGERDADRVRLEIVGLWNGDSLRAVPTEHDLPRIGEALAAGPLAGGTEWILFADGARVGELVVDSVVDEGEACETGLPQVEGEVRVIPQAVSAEALVALPRDYAGRRDFGSYRPLRHNYAQRVGSLSMASGIVATEGAAWPSEGFLSIRREITAFAVGGGPEDRFFAATFTLGDEVAVGPVSPTALETAYSIFVMGGGDEEGRIFTAYSDFRKAGAGKAVPSFFDRVDIDGDGADEVLLRIHGEQDAGWQVIRGRGRFWRSLFEDEPCRAATGG